jgi:hypothetical protein
MSDETFSSLIEEDNKNLADIDLRVQEEIITKVTIVERQLNHDEIHINPAYEKINPVGKHDPKERYFNALKGFIETNGQRSPIVINQHCVILDGHKTFRACKELGLSPVRCEVKIFEDELDEQVFIIYSNLNPILPEFQQCELLMELGKVLKSKVLLRQNMTYLTNATWMGSYLVSLEFRCNILDWRLCCFCIVDKKEDPFVGPYPKEMDEDKWSRHILHHLEHDGGWTKYAPKLLYFPREIDPKTHDWRFKPVENAKELIQEFLANNCRSNATVSQSEKEASV